MLERSACYARTARTGGIIARVAFVRHSHRGSRNCFPRRVYRSNDRSGNWLQRPFHPAAHPALLARYLFAQTRTISSLADHIQASGQPSALHENDERRPGPCCGERSLDPCSMTKRLFDVVVSGIALLLLSPLLVVLGILVKLDSPGPALFRQERVGRYGRPFRIHKFRTMREGERAPA